MSDRKRRGLWCWLFGCLWETYQRVGPGGILLGLPTVKCSRCGRTDNG